MTPFTIPCPLTIRRVAYCRDLTAKPDLSFVPPIQRRRLSAVQAHTFAIAHELTQGLPPEITRNIPLIFALHYGEYTLTRRIVHDFQTLGEVSPTRFSTSVYNAAPGLYSIFTQNTAPYTAIAGGENTTETGLLEALTTPGLRLWILADEPCAPDACAMGALLDDAPNATAAFSATRLPGSPNAPAATPALALKQFFLQERPLLQTRTFTLVRTP